MTLGWSPESLQTVLRRILFSFLHYFLFHLSFISFIKRVRYLQKLLSLSWMGRFSFRLWSLLVLTNVWAVNQLTFFIAFQKLYFRPHLIWLSLFFNLLILSVSVFLFFDRYRKSLNATFDMMVFGVSQVKADMIKRTFIFFLTFLGNSWFFVHFIQLLLDFFVY